eukprot:GFUD01130284.1.p1 GENE.GFUD01130284.1~~GFUD01130284.1.p1  ORF type:complete len:322 (-),score=68.72 GFUD01130284.1:116-1081(-)
MSSKKYKKRLRKEFSLAQDEGEYNVELVGDNLAEWKVEMPVDGYGVVELVINFPEDYPFSPPRVKISRIFHPNVFTNGTLCMSLLHAGMSVGDVETMDEKWSPAIGVSNLLASISSVLSDPNLDSPANIDARQMYSSNYPEYLAKNEDLARLRANNKVRKEQETEFQEAQILDQKRECAQRMQEEQQRMLEEQQRFEDQVRECKRRSELEAKEAEEVLAAADRSAAALTLQPEPAANCSEVMAKIRFRLPSSSLVRRFLGSSQLSELLQYLRSEGFKPEEFKILTSYPRRDLSKLDPTVTLEALALCPQETISLAAINCED